MNNIDVNYHSSIKINDIYVDPFEIKNNKKDARIIFITHSHYDHFSVKDIDKIVNNSTVFVCTEDVKLELEKLYKNKIVVASVNESYVVDDVKFTTFPSYNEGKPFHPRSNNWVGYVIEVNGVKYAIIGDSDKTSEVMTIKCDVLFVPIGGTYTMNAKEASELVNVIKPKLVIPVHYNGIVGNKDNEKEFLDNIKDIEYKIYL